MHLRQAKRIGDQFLSNRKFETVVQHKTARTQPGFQVKQKARDSGDRAPLADISQASVKFVELGSHLRSQTRSLFFGIK
jgi:hypothetical protein